MWHGKEVVRFWWPWPHFQGHTSILNVKFWPRKACLHPISWTKWWILAKHYALYHWDNEKNRLDFGDLDLIFQGHYAIKTVKMSLVCSLLNQMVDFDQTYTETPLGHGKVITTVLDFGDFDFIFKVTPVLWTSNFDPKKRLHPISWTKWWVLANLYILYHWDN